MNIYFWLNGTAESQLTSTDVIALIAVIAATLVFIALAVVIAVKKRTNRSFEDLAPEVIPEEDDNEIIAAITAAIATILEEEAKEDERKAPKFRVVAFRRTNNRRIGK